MRLIVVFACSVAVVLSGCTAAFKGEPERSFTSGELVQTQANDDFARRVVLATLDSAFTAEGGLRTIDAAQRNAIIYARLAEIDTLYYDFEIRFSRELRESDFVASLVGVGVGAAGSLVAESASQILSAISGGVAGTQKAFDSDVLADQTIQAFVSQMRAQRLKVRSRIVRKLSATMQTYPLQSALSDLADYLQAGTLTGAINGLAETSGAAKDAAEQELGETEMIEIDRQVQTVTQTARDVLGWMRAPASEQGKNERRQQARTCYDKIEVADKPVSFALSLTDAGRFSAVETALVRCLNTDFAAGIAQ